MTLPPSLIEQAVYIVQELGIDKDFPTPHEYGKLVSNLAMLRMNAFLDVPSEQRGTRGDGIDPIPSPTWAAFIDHLMYPDHKPLPKGLFAVESLHYKLALQAIDEIYNKYGE